METKKQTKEELQEIVLKRAEELTLLTGKKVYGEVVNTEPFGSTEGEWVAFYIKAPSLYQKAQIIDVFEGPNRTMKGIEIIRTNLLKEHSHPRFSNLEDPNNENIILGAALYITGQAFVFSIIEKREELKKNG